MTQRPKPMSFSIGEFSKLTGVPKQTLQFYDKIGVFSPSLRLENGYRYYEAEQYDTVEIIYALKEGGLPLQEIKSYLDHRTPELCIQLLEKEEKRIQEKIKNLQKTLQLIEQKRSSTVKGIQARQKEQKCFYEMREEEHLITWDFKNLDFSEHMVEIIKMVNWCFDEGFYTGYAMGAIKEKEELLAADHRQISQMFMKIDHFVDNPKYRNRPRGLYGIYHFKGCYEDVSKAYEWLLATIESDGYRMTGPSYETGLLDYFSVRSSEEYLTEIAIPVQKKEEEGVANEE